MSTQAKIILSAEDRASPAFKTVQASFAQTLRSSELLRNSVAGLAAGFSVSAITGYAKGLAQAGVEADRLARLANTNVERFQAEAFAAERAGISQEKYADILKDVQDKVGDFLQNGGGPLKDFFDNIAPRVGVTAEQFRKLGGSDALQLYASSLQKANIGQSDLTFYMEAIASDSALLLPLLSDNGTEMKRFGDEAQRLGLVLDRNAIASLKQFDDQLRLLSANASGFGRQVALPIIEWVNRMSLEFSTGIKNANGFFDALRTFGGVGGSERAGPELRKYTAELDKLQKAREALIDREGVMANTSGFDREIDTARRRVAYFRQLQALTVRFSPDDQSSAEAARLGLTPRATSSNPDPNNPPGRPTRPVAEIIPPDLEIESITATFKGLYDLRDERARRSAEIYQQMLTPIEQLAQKEAELETLRAAGLIGEETLVRARLAAAEDYDEAMGRAISTTTEAVQLVDELSAASLQAAERMQAALGDQLFNALDGRFGDIGDAFGNMIKRMVAESLSADIMNALFGAVRTSSTGVNSRGGGFLGDLGSAILGNFLPSFAGGGHTGYGPRAGGLDGQGGYLAMLHPRETVLDHTKGQGGSNTTVIINNTIGSVASQADVVAGMQQTRAQIMGELQRSRAYGGVAV